MINGGFGQRTTDGENIDGSFLRQDKGAWVAADQKPRGIGGWLLFLCVILAVIVPIVNLSTAIAGGVPGVVLFGTAMGIFSLVAGLLLWSKASSGPPVTRAFFITNIVYVVVAALGNHNALSVAVMGGLGATGTACIWILYLGISKRVKNTFPSSARGSFEDSKESNSDYPQRGTRQGQSGVAQLAAEETRNADPTGSDVELVASLEKLAKMKSDGFLTEEEFSTLKRRILARPETDTPTVHETDVSGEKMWVCPKCGAINESSRTTCSDCDYARTLE